MAELLKSKIELEVAGKKYPVLKCGYNLHRNVDYDGQPTSPMRIKQITFTIEAFKEDELLAWACDPSGLRSGKVYFYERLESLKLKEFEFTDAFVVEYTEEYDESGSGTVSLILAPSKITDGNVTVDNSWILASS